MSVALQALGILGPAFGQQYVEQFAGRDVHLSADVTDSDDDPF